MSHIVPETQNQRLIFFSRALMWSFFFFFSAITTSPAAERFPLYPCIKANVKFWEDIYSRYSSQQGILHDSENLSRVYTVVELESSDVPGSAKINNDRIKAAKSRISDILLRLGSGKRAVTREEKFIAHLFPKQRHTMYHVARENIRLQIGQKDRFREGLIRSGKYIGPFKKMLISQGLPADLAYLPHVESSFNPKAYSKAGAAGLWQFTRSTGKDYLTINEHVDERYDPFLATQAAVKLLKENYAQLRNWPLALTAYNYGRAGMLRAVNEKGSYENIFDSYSQGYFKFASRNFYSEFLAALRVAKRLRGNPTIPFERQEATVTFRLTQDLPAKRLQSTYRISAQNFARLNPALMQSILDGHRSVPKGYLVRLPAKKQAGTQLAVVKLKKGTIKQKASLKRRTAPGQSHIRYTVQKGDTISSIARQFRLAPPKLLATNNRNRQTDIRIGEKLIIPVLRNKNL